MCNLGAPCRRAIERPGLLRPLSFWRWCGRDTQRPGDALLLFDEFLEERFARRWIQWRSRRRSRDRRHPKLREIASEVLEERDLLLAQIVRELLKERVGPIEIERGLRARAGRLHAANGSQRRAPQALFRRREARPARNGCGEVDLAPLGMPWRLAKILEPVEEPVDEPHNFVIALRAWRPVVRHHHRAHGDCIDTAAFLDEARIVAGGEGW